MRLGSIDLSKLRSLGDKAAGLSTELVGAVTGNDALQDAGQAQQDKASERLRAMRAEVKAEEKDAKADALEKRQKAAQAAKG